MENKEIYPADQWDHKRTAFEAGLPKIAVEQYAHSDDSVQFMNLTARNRNGRYVFDWVRGAWDGYKMALEQNPEL